MSNDDNLVEQFLTPDEESRIVKAIIEAEKRTSGEIRIHIEHHAHKQPLERAQEVFYELGMNKTELENGVLLYIGVADKTFAIIGDKGINNLVEEDFWNCTKDLILHHFKKQEFSEGLIHGVQHVGQRLAQFFPPTGEDKNELSNEISKS